MTEEKEEYLGPRLFLCPNCSMLNADYGFGECLFCGEELDMSEVVYESD